MQIWPNETGFGSGNYKMSETKKKWLVSQWWLCLAFTNVICQLDVLWPDYEAFHYKLLIQRFYGPRGKTRREVDRKFRRKNKRKSIANNRAIWSVMLCIWCNLLLHHSVQSQTWILLLHMDVRHDTHNAWALSKDTILLLQNSLSALVSNIWSTSPSANSGRGQMCSFKLHYNILVKQTFHFKPVWFFKPVSCEILLFLLLLSSLPPLLFFLKQRKCVFSYGQQDMKIIIKKGSKLFCHMTVSVLMFLVCIKKDWNKP